MNNIIGKNIRLLREKNKMTQLDISKVLGYKTTSIISEIENGKKGIKTEKLSILAKLLNCKIDEFFLV